MTRPISRSGIPKRWEDQRLADINLQADSDEIRNSVCDLMNRKPIYTVTNATKGRTLTATSPLTTVARVLCTLLYDLDKKNIIG